MVANKKGVLVGKASTGEAVFRRGNIKLEMDQWRHVSCSSSRVKRG